ncbi:hypothetical protein AB4Z51_24450 [Bradyrhizobium sp. 2TAF36]|uniref:hypothetical protein n=1 Tax=Bradyrhizobium sp. 2TAF36 TaxID=3233016 RepID=UPI003F90D627
MNEVPLTIRVPYEQWFVPRRCRTMRPDWFMDQRPVMIPLVEPEEAPIAYRIKSNPLPLAPDECRDYAVRVLDEKFWWPLSRSDGKGFVSPAEFSQAAATGLPQAVLAIDPSISVPTGRWPLNLFDQGSVRSVGESDRELRWGYVQANRLRLAFCGNQVLVEAGEPVFYAVPSRGGVEIDVGPSAWDRCKQRDELPGPDRQQRREAARKGLAFGLGEVEGGLRVLADNGFGVHRTADIEILICASETGAAALLCARALAEFLWEEAGHDGFWTDALKRSVRAIANSGAPGASAQDLVHRDVLEQIAWSNDTVVLREYFKEVRAARDILARWKVLGISGFAAKDDAALALLAG